MPPRRNTVRPRVTNCASDSPTAPSPPLASTDPQRRNDSSADSSLNLRRMASLQPGFQALHSTGNPQPHRDSDVLHVVQPRFNSPNAETPPPPLRRVPQGPAHTFGEGRPVVGLESMLDSETNSLPLRERFYALPEDELRRYVNIHKECQAAAAAASNARFEPVPETQGEGPETPGDGPSQETGTDSQLHPPQPMPDLDDSSQRVGPTDVLGEESRTLITPMGKKWYLYSDSRSSDYYIEAYYIVF